MQVDAMRAQYWYVKALFTHVYSILRGWIGRFVGFPQKIRDELGQGAVERAPGDK